MKILWLRTTSLWTVLLTVGAPLVLEGFLCRVVLLLALAGDLLLPLSLLLDLALDLSWFSITGQTALTISDTLSSFGFLFWLPRELDLERLRFEACFPYPHLGECEVSSCLLF